MQNKTVKHLNALIEIYSKWPQASKKKASKHPHAVQQCSYTSVGVTQAHPNQLLQARVHCCNEILLQVSEIRGSSLSP